MKKQFNKPEILDTPLRLRNMTIKNRFIRSATYDGYGDSNGMPIPETADFFSELAEGGVGAIITGFAYVSRTGSAMQPRQYGIDSDDKIAPWRDIVNNVREKTPDVSLIMQIAHCGRQTKQAMTGLPAVGVSSKKCTYYRQRVKVLDDASIVAIIDEFAEAARRAKDAGFDGIQLHGSHGYLIHQFLSPWTNYRKDRWADGPLFLEKIIERTRELCGEEFPILVKLSYTEHREPGVRLEDTVETVKRLERLSIDAVEISSGTLEYALNIMRGACPLDLILRVNPTYNRIPRLLQKFWKKYFSQNLLNKFIPFEENYNLAGAEAIKKETSLPVIAVGGLRTVESMVKCIATSGLDAVSMCRPLVCEPDLPAKILRGETTKARCTSCNLCTIYSDTPRKIRCYLPKRSGAPTL